MGGLPADKLADVKFKIEASGNELKFSGCIDLQDPEPVITPFFNKIHQKILNENIKEVSLNFKELTFLNSSGIKTITKWIMKIPPLPDNKKYKLKLLYSEEITWQRTSLMILTYLAPGNVEAIAG
jgi:hypothetical protein